MRLTASRSQVPVSKFFFLFEVDGQLRVSENEMYEPRKQSAKSLAEVRAFIVCMCTSLSHRRTSCDCTVVD